MKQQEFFNRYKYNTEADYIGGGTFGDVYKAYDLKEDKEVAIKVAKIVKYGDKTFSLKDEFEAVKDLPVHQNIANYYAIYTYNQPTGNYDFAVIQYYKDGNLSELIKVNDLSFQEKENIAIQLLDGLEFLHKHRVVHRDMKPSNILIHKRKLSQKEQVIPKIADFGLSKKAKGDRSRFTNSFGGGTLSYSSPEQLKNQTLKFNTDLWAWGVIVYELFTGKRLFDAKETQSTGSAEQENEIYQQILDKNIQTELTNLPTNWINALSQCLERNPDKRIKTAVEVKEILQGEAQTSEQDFEQTIIQADEETVIQPKKEDDLKKREKSEASIPKDESKKKSKLPIYLGVVAILLLIFSVFWLISNKNTPKEDTATELIVVQKNDKFGFIDKTGKEVIPLMYDEAYDFSEGLAMVQLNDKYGYIDKTGKEVIPLKYDLAYDFSEGLARVFLNDKVGFVDKTGKEVIPFIYENSWGFSGGLAAVGLNGKWGYIDKTGKEVIPFKYSDARSFSEGLAKVELNYRWGYIDKTGKEVVSNKYDYAEDFSEGLAKVEINAKDGLIDKVGFIDKTGKEVIPLMYDSALSFSEGLASVRLNGKPGFIDKTGKEVISLIYDAADDFSEGLAAVRLNGKWGFIDKTGKEVIPLKYYYARIFSEGLVMVILNDKVGFIDKTGKEVIPLIYDELFSYSGGIIGVLLNGKFFYINKEGQCIRDCENAPADHPRK